MPFALGKLPVYQKAVTFADAAYSPTEGFPRGDFFLGDQLNRAALSIAAIIAEGNGHFTKPDRKNFFGIARGSVQECVALLELATRQGLLTPDRHGQLKADIEEIARMLSGLINGSDKRETRSIRGTHEWPRPCATALRAVFRVSVSLSCGTADTAVAVRLKVYSIGGVQVPFRQTLSGL